MSTTTAEAYDVCETITKQQARNFYYGIRLLPDRKRSALCAVYALARRIDDIGDGDLPVPDKVAELGTLRGALRNVATGAESTDPVLAAVTSAARRFPIPLSAFEELVDGVEMDVTGRTYETFDELVTYCRRVAGSVGRLSLAVFGGPPDRRAASYADSLGIALQQTNILRDIREDLGNGRVYLPQEDLDRFGVELRTDEHRVLVDPDGALGALIRHSAERAGSWYDEGQRLMPMLDRRSAACASAMAGIYRRLLLRIAAAPSTVYGQRLSLSGWEKAGVAARALTGLPA